MSTRTTRRRAAPQEPLTPVQARVPDRLAECLMAEAVAERRSLSAQLEVILDERYAGAHGETEAA